MKKILSFSLLILLITFGCQKEEDLVESACRVNYSIKENQQKEFEGKWKFIGFQNEGADKIDYPPCVAYENNANFQITLNFEDGVYSGKALNQYSGYYTVNNQQISTGEASLSTSYTEPAELLNYETRFIKALEEGKNFNIFHNVLTIYYGDEGKSLLFEAREESK